MHHNFAFTIAVEVILTARQAFAWIEMIHRHKCAPPHAKAIQAVQQINTIFDYKEGDIADNLLKTRNAKLKFMLSHKVVLVFKKLK